MEADTHPEQLLSTHYPLETLRTLLMPVEKWQPYPTLDDRAAWDDLPNSVRKAYLAHGEKVLGLEWPLLLATRYLDFARDGNRSRYAGPYFARRAMLGALVIAECIENQGRFLDEIVNGLWLICEESSWCVPAHISTQQAGMGLPDTSEPIVDLFAAETAAQLAWTHYLLGPTLDTVSPLVRPRIQREVQARILAPCLERDDFWWMGFTPREVNNWNPWINSNWLTAALLLETDPEQRLASVSKALRSLDRFIGPYPKDGGCDEGPGYWGRAGASLLDCLELLYSATGSQLNVYDVPLIQDIGRFIYRVQIADDYFVNFADASAIVHPPPWVVFRYGQRIGDESLMHLGAWLAREADLLCKNYTKEKYRSLPTGLDRLLPTLFNVETLYNFKPVQPLPRDVWLDQVQVMVARDRPGTSTGLCVAAKGGHNAESHNHNDVGNFIIYVNGNPVIIDAGVETYTRKTFSPERYTIWTMQSAYHSLLPTIDGQMQCPGREFAAHNVAYKNEELSASLTLDLAGAYSTEAKLKSWQRTIMLRRGWSVQVNDVYELSEPVREITFSLLTPCVVKKESKPDVISLSETLMGDGRRTGVAYITYEHRRLEFSTETIAIEDKRLSRIWGDYLTRLIFRAHPEALRGELILRVYL